MTGICGHITSDFCRAGLQLGCVEKGIQFVQSYIIHIIYDKPSLEGKRHPQLHQNPPSLLVKLDRLKQCLKVTLTKTAITFPLNKLEENWPYAVFGENLQQDPPPCFSPPSIRILRLWSSATLSPCPGSRWSIFS